MSETIRIEVPLSDLQEVEGALRRQGVGVTTLESRGFGGIATGTVIVTLTGMALRAITSLYKERQATRRATKLKYRGIELEGPSDAILVDLIKRIGAGEPEKPDVDAPD